MPRPTNEAPVRIGTPGVMPRHMIAPPHWIGGWRGVHLGAHGRMQTVRADQQGPLDLAALAVARLDQCPDAAAVVVIAVAGDRQAGSNGVCAETLDDGPVEQHLQTAAVHRILRPLVAGAQAARLGVHLLAVQSDQHPFPGLQPDGVELLGPDPEFVELAHRVRLQVDAHPERLEVPHGFQHEARHADLMQGQSDTQSSNAAPGNEDRSMIHGCA